MTNLTAASLALFTALAQDSGNWSGNPLVDVSPAEKGNLTHLKTSGLLTTFDDDGCMFVTWTEAGIEFAATELGMSKDDLGIWC